MTLPTSQNKSPAGVAKVTVTDNGEVAARAATTIGADIPLCARRAKVETSSSQSRVAPSDLADALARAVRQLPDPPIYRSDELATVKFMADIYLTARGELNPHGQPGDLT